jgi:dCTP deaminase
MLILILIAQLLVIIAIICCVSEKDCTVLTYNDLIQLIDDGVINASKSQVHGSSIDVTLHHLIRREQMGSQMDKVHLGRGDTLKTELIDMREIGSFAMMPAEFVLAGTVETLKLPGNLSCEFKLRSSIGRSALNHALSGWVDPYFEGNLTLELTNTSRFKKLVLEPGLVIGQLVFYRHATVPPEHGYAKNGRYNGQTGVTESKGVAERIDKNQPA